MGMGPHILGHSPKAVISAVRQALDEGQLFAGQNLYEVELAELFVSLLPWIEQIRIGLSGTEMNLLAVRIARAHTGKQKSLDSPVTITDGLTRYSLIHHRLIQQTRII